MSTTLPQMSSPELYITDGGLETTIVFQQGVDLPDFAAFPLLDTADGRRTLQDYFEPYLALAERLGTGFVLDTPTWRANPDWGARLGYDEAALVDVNTRAVAFARDLVRDRPNIHAVIDGVIGPRGDGYVVGVAMTAPEAAAYHALQIGALAAAGVDMITAVTMNYTDEGRGIAIAARDAAVPVVVSFTVETDGVLPSGESLGDAIAAVDAATDAYPSYYMVNCAHPTHFTSTLRAGEAWRDRVGAIRANASTKSHAELDEATELDRGDIEGLATQHVELASLLPNLCVAGGCCGTDHEHVTAIATALRR